MLFLISATSPWGLYKLWGGKFPTSDIDHYRPRLRHLLLHTLIEPYLTPLLPSDLPSTHPYYSFLPTHRVIYPPVYHLYTSHHTKKTLLPYLPSLVTTRSWLFLSPLALTTPAILLSPTPPHWYRNIF